jgi:hypothetical protein
MFLLIFGKASLTGKLLHEAGLSKTREYSKAIGVAKEVTGDLPVVRPGLPPKLKFVRQPFSSVLETNHGDDRPTHLEQDFWARDGPIQEAGSGILSTPKTKLRCSMRGLD